MVLNLFCTRMTEKGRGGKGGKEGEGRGGKGREGKESERKGREWERREGKGREGVVDWKNGILLDLVFAQCTFISIIPLFR